VQSMCCVLFHCNWWCVSDTNVRHIMTHLGPIKPYIHTPNPSIPSFLSCTTRTRVTLQVIDWLTDGQSVSQYVLGSSPIWGSWPDVCLLFDSYGPVLFMRPLWREVGSVFVSHSLMSLLICTSIIYI
jgi:hypothetical protein